MILLQDGPYSQPRETRTSESIAFPPIPTPIGSFTIRTVYRSHPHYSLETLESLLSRSHFLSPEYEEDMYAQRQNLPSRERTSSTQQEVKKDTHGGGGFTPTLTSALTRERERQRRDSYPDSAYTSPSRSPLPLPLPLPDRAPPLLDRDKRPFPIRADLEFSSTRAETSSTPGFASSGSPLGALPIRSGQLPMTSGVGSAPISVPIRQQHHFAQHGTAGTSPSNDSSLSSSPNLLSQRVRRISALGSVPSDQHFPSALASGGGTTLGSLGGGAASNSSPRFGFMHGREPSDLPFAVGLGSGRTSGQLGHASGALSTTDRTRERKESLLGASSTSTVSQNVTAICQPTYSRHFHNVSNRIHEHSRRSQLMVVGLPSTRFTLSNLRQFHRLHHRHPFVGLPCWLKPGKLRDPLYRHHQAVLLCRYLPPLARHPSQP